jgi:hypothetical protein
MTPKQDTILVNVAMAISIGAMLFGIISIINNLT